MRRIKIFLIILFIGFGIVYVTCSVNSSTWDMLQWTKEIKDILIQVIIGIIGMSILLTYIIDEL